MQGKFRQLLNDVINIHSQRFHMYTDRILFGNIMSCIGNKDQILDKDKGI